MSERIFFENLPLVEPWDGARWEYFQWRFHKHHHQWLWSLLWCEVLVGSPILSRGSRHWSWYRGGYKLTGSYLRYLSEVAKKSNICPFIIGHILTIGVWGHNEVESQMSNFNSYIPEYHQKLIPKYQDQVRQKVANQFARRDHQLIHHWSLRNTKYGMTHTVWECPVAKFRKNTWIVALSPSKRIISPTSLSWPTRTSSYIAAPIFKR